MNWISSLAFEFRAWRERRSAVREMGALQRRERIFLQLDDNNLINRAKSSLSSNNKAAALAYWTEALERYPDLAKSSPDAYHIEIALGRLDEAEAIIREGMKRSSRDPEYFVGYAWVARERGDFEEALKRWEQFRRKFPSEPRGYMGGSVCLRQLKRFDEAEKLLTIGSRVFSGNIDILIEQANVAEARSDLPTALERWQSISSKGWYVRGAVGVARVLSLMGRYDEAEGCLKEVAKAQPGRKELADGLARIAEMRKASVASTND